MNTISDFIVRLFSDYDFWNGFLANLLSDVFVGVVLGWFLGKKLNQLAHSQQLKAEKRTELEKAMRYLEILKAESTNLITHIPEFIDAFKRGSTMIINTSLWDILQPSGELPRFLIPDVLISLTVFYSQITVAQQASSWIMDRFDSPSPSRQQVKELALSGLEKALELGKDLPENLDSEIQRLKEQLKEH